MATDFLADDFDDTPKHKNTSGGTDFLAEDEPTSQVASSRGIPLPGNNNMLDPANHLFVGDDGKLDERSQALLDNNFNVQSRKVLPGEDPVKVAIEMTGSGSGSVIAQPVPVQPVAQPQMMMTKEKVDFPLPVAQPKPVVPVSPVKRTVMEILVDSFSGNDPERKSREKAVGEASRIGSNIVTGIPASIVGGVAAAVPLAAEVMSTQYKDPTKSQSISDAGLLNANKVLETVSQFPTIKPPTKEAAKQEEQVGEAINWPFKTAGLGWGGIVEAISTGDLNKATDVIEGRSEGSNVAVPWAKVLGEASAIFAVGGFKKAFKDRVLNTNWFRKLSVRERGLVVQSLDDIVNSNMSLGEAARKYPNIFKSELAKRTTGEAPTTGETVAKPTVEPVVKAEVKTAETVLKPAEEAMIKEKLGLTAEEIKDIKLQAAEKRKAAAALAASPEGAKGADLLAEDMKPERSNVDVGVNKKLTAELETQKKILGAMKAEPTINDEAKARQVFAQEEVIKNLEKEVLSNATQQKKVQAETKTKVVKPNFMQEDMESEGGVNYKPAVKPLKASGFEPTHNLFNTPALGRNTTYAWRSMGEKEYNKLVAGEKEYLGDKQASKGNFLAGIPESAGQFGGKGKYLVEFGGVKIAGDEGLLPGSKATKDNITKVWKYDDKAKGWVEQKRVVGDKAPLVAKSERNFMQEAEERVDTPEDLAYYDRMNKEAEFRMKQTEIDRYLFADKDGRIKIVRQISDLVQDGEPLTKEQKLIFNGASDAELKKFNDKNTIDVTPERDLLDKIEITGGIDLPAHKREKLKDVLGYDAVRTVIGELLQNAFDATRDNGSPITITVGVGSVTVSENGKGMNPDQAQNDLVKLSKQGSKGEKDMGGLGVAKLPIMGYPDTFHITTVGELNGKKYESVVSGDREHYMEYDKMDFDSKEVPLNTPTGTTVTLKHDSFTPSKIKDVVRQIVQQLRTPQEVIVHDLTSGSYSIPVKTPFELQSSISQLESQAKMNAANPVIISELKRVYSDLITRDIFKRYDELSEEDLADISRIVPYEQHPEFNSQEELIKDMLHNFYDWDFLDKNPSSIRKTLSEIFIHPKWLKESWDMVTTNLSKPTREYLGEIPDINTNKPPTKYTGAKLEDAESAYKPTILKLPGGNEVYIKYTKTEPYGWSGGNNRYRITANVYNKGLPLPDITRYSFLSNLELSRKPNFKIEINFTKTPPASDTANYAFAVNRSRMQPFVEDPIKESITDFLSDMELHISKASVKDLKSKFNNAPTVNGVKIIIPYDDPIIVDKVSSIIKANSEMFKKLGHLYKSFGKVLAAKTQIPPHVFALTTDQGLHGFRPRTGVFPDNYIVVNPFSFFVIEDFKKLERSIAQLEPLVVKAKTPEDMLGDWRRFYLNKFRSGNITEAEYQSANDTLDRDQDSVLLDFANRNLYSLIDPKAKPSNRLWKQFNDVVPSDIDKLKNDYNTLLREAATDLLMTMPHEAVHTEVSDHYVAYVQAFHRLIKKIGIEGLYPLEKEAYGFARVYGKDLGRIGRDIATAQQGGNISNCFSNYTPESRTTEGSEEKSPVHARRIEVDRGEGKGELQVSKPLTVNVAPYYGEHIARMLGGKYVGEKTSEVKVPLFLLTSKTPGVHYAYSGIDPIVMLRSLGKTAEDIGNGVKYLEQMGEKIYKDGKKTYSEWADEFKTRLGELWERFKDSLKDIWDRAYGILKDETGAVGKDIRNGKKDINVGKLDKKGNIIAHQRLIRVSKKTKLDFDIEQLSKVRDTARHELEEVRGENGKAKFEKLKADRINALINDLSKLKTDAAQNERIGYAKAIEEVKAVGRIKQISRLERIVAGIEKQLGEKALASATNKDNIDTVAPPVLKKDLALMMSLKDRDRYLFGGVTVNPIFNLERWGNQNQVEDFKKSFKDNKTIPYDKTTAFTILEKFYHPFVDARDAADRSFEKVWKEAKEVRKHLPIGSAKRIGVYSIAQQVSTDPKKSGQTILDAMGIPAEKVPVLTPDEMKVYKWMQKQYEDIYEKLNKARIASGLRVFDKVENYHKFAADLSFADKLKFGLDDQYIVDNMKASATDFASAKERVGGLEKVNLDAFQVFDKYMKTAMEHINLSPEIAKMRELIEVEHSWKEKAKDKNGKDITITHRYTMKRNQQRMYKDLTEYINTVAGRKKVILPASWEKGLSILRNNVVTSYLSASLRSVLIQPAALLNTYTIIGPKHTMKGTIGMLDKTRKEALEESKVLKYRNMDLNVIETTSGAAGHIDAWRQWFNKNIGMAPLRGFDKGTATISRIGAKTYAMEELGLDDYAANRYADNLVIKTQSSAALHDLPPILRHELGKTIMTLQSFVITNWNWLTKDVMGIGNASIKNSRMFHLVMRFALGLAIINAIFEDGIGINSPMPAPVREAVKSYNKDGSIARAGYNAGLEFAQFAPGLGGFRYGSGILGAPLGFLDDIGKKMAELSGGYVGPTKPALELVATGLGIPGTKQASRIVNITEKGGDPVNAILGKYPDKTSGGLKSSLKSGTKSSLKSSLK